MSRTLAVTALAVAAGWGALYLFVGGRDDLYTAAELLIIVVSAAVIVHMFVDRYLRYWESTSVSILLGEIGWIALFGWFAVRAIWGRGSLTPGQSEGWLDLVLALVLLGRPLLLVSVILFRLGKRRRGETMQPGELLTQGLPYNGPERRAGPTDRRHGNVYGRITGHSHDVGDG